MTTVRAVSRWLPADTEAASRFTRSALAADSPLTSLASFSAWFAERQLAQRTTVAHIPFGELDGWRFAEGSGNLVHRSGRFFTVQGLQVHNPGGPVTEWSQPIICQPEIGILGFLVKEFDGVLHVLAQAKMEPGNINSVQLSPTVQATFSNYTGVHRGAAVRYLEYFTEPGRGRLLVDVLQSEQGSWFWGKRNRNMVVEVFEDIPEHEDFRWLALGQIQTLLRRDNVVNMDMRTVLACIPFRRPANATNGAFGDGLVRSLAGRGTRHDTADVLSWFTEAKSRSTTTRWCVDLAGITGWTRSGHEISHEDGRYFNVIAASVETISREVGSWTQPLFEPVGEGVVAFLTRNINDVVHVLVHARMEPGLLDLVELAPTVQCGPDNYRGLPPHRQPRYLDYVLGVDPAKVRFEARLSEEGGRFHNSVSRYLVIDAGDDLPLDVPDEYRWLALGQLTELVQHSYHLNVQSRTLLACLHSLWGARSR